MRSSDSPSRTLWLVGRASSSFFAFLLLLRSLSRSAFLRFDDFTSSRSSLLLRLFVFALAFDLADSSSATWRVVRLLAVAFSSSIASFCFLLLLAVVGAVSAFCFLAVAGAGTGVSAFCFFEAVARPSISSFTL